MGEPVENLLKNPDFEGEFDVNPDTKLATRIEGWDIVISDRWNSEQQIIPEEIDNNQDINNHVFEIRPYKWATGWSCLLYTSPSPRDLSTSRMPSSA